MTTSFALPARYVGPGFGVYVLIACVGHWIAGGAFVWPFAAAMMVVMTVTYPLEAWFRGEGLPIEAGFAIGLSAMAVIGAFTTPLLIIAAIFAHGLLDIAKWLGLGVTFYRAYLFGCALFDVVYAAALLLYFTHIGGFAS